VPALLLGLPLALDCREVLEVHVFFRFIRSAPMSLYRIVDLCDAKEQSHVWVHWELGASLHGCRGCCCGLNAGDSNVLVCISILRIYLFVSIQEFMRWSYC
jgi:hypothetical protein